MKENVRKYLLLLVLAGAVAVILLKPGNENLSSIAGQMQARLNATEALFGRVAAGENTYRQLAAGQVDAPALAGLQAKGLLLYYYRNDSLLAWTDNSITPPSTLAADAGGASFVHLKNGWYQVMKRTRPGTHETLVGLTLVKYGFPFENRLLENRFALNLKVPNNVELSEQQIKGGAEVKNAAGALLFSLYFSGSEKEEDVAVLMLIAELLLLLIVFYFIQRLALMLNARGNFYGALLLLAALLVILRGLMLAFGNYAEWHKLPLFDPGYYASSVLTPSLGDLAIDCAFICWIVFFAAKHHLQRQAVKLPRAMHAALVGLLFAYTGYIVWLVKTLVMDSLISFEVYNILSLNTYSLLGMLCIGMLLVTHFTIARWVLKLLLQAGVKVVTVLLFSMAFGAFFALSALFSTFYESIIWSALWCVVYFPLMYLLYGKNSGVTFRSILFAAALYSGLCTYLLENIYEQKERNQRAFFSDKLVEERDFVAEYLYRNVAARIYDDQFVKNFFSNPLVTKKEITSRISLLYFGGYFNKYDLTLLPFNSAGHAIQSTDSVTIAPYLELLKGDSDVYSLHYLSDSSINYSYLSVLPFKSDSAQGGYIVLRLSPKMYYGQNVYPELLIGQNVAGGNAYNYSYAIYKNDNLIGQSGDYPYTYHWDKNFKFYGRNFIFNDDDPNWEHSFQKFPNGKKVIVTVAREPLFEPVATFSYLFTFFFSLAIGVVLLGRLLNAKNAFNELKENFGLSFRTRINYSMLLMIVFSFIIIGLITIGFFRRQYNNFYTDRLLRKEKVIHAGVEDFIQKYSPNGSAGESLKGDNDLNYEVARLAEINAIDINLFGAGGDLLVASQPAIYDRGLVSKKMNPSAYFELKDTRSAQVTRQEAIGHLKYLATYSPIRNSHGETLAYLGIPYFERTRDINSEVSNFLVALMNVYVFLLICAALLAYFISSSITRPLTIISEKLRILNLNKKNEPIEWNSRDEIGVLIGEYNKMITELERSARKLARSERESAWREMAKQIAHEIKNPLTPMKLSIQYLQRAIDEGHPNVEQLAKKVTRTLEEQIENLSSIATAFSSFAKMPRPENELINMNDLLRSIAELFNREGNVKVTFTSQVDSPIIYADKNQMISVFNNLVKNAIQSVPETREGEVAITITAEDDLIKIAVSDNGTGIPEDLYEKVFVPNFTTKSSGTGLGLAITRQIIDGVGGKIWFESREGEGTTFIVRLRKEKY